jgi:hypothetical protein
MLRSRQSLVAILALPVLGFAQAPDLILMGKAPNSQYGSSITSAGDVDADGHADILIGAPIDRRTTERSGALELRSGRDSRLMATWLGPGLGDELGFAADGAGDVNKDGHADILCGVLGGVGPTESFIGNARVYSGKDYRRLHTSRGANHYDFFGLAVAGLGDLDGDGAGDYAFGCPGDDRDGRNRGYLEVHSGQSGAVMYTLRGSIDGAQFGWFARPVGDCDKDGVLDFAVGAPGHERDHPPSGRAGYVDLYSGRDGRLLLHIEGSVVESHLGWQVAAIGDLDADGTPDILAGAPFEPMTAGGKEAGAAYVFSGRDGKVLLAVPGIQAGARSGWNVFGAGDLSGDGKPDFWVSSPLWDDAGGGVDRGMVQLVSGADGSSLLTLEGRFAKSEFGFAVCDLGPTADGPEHRLAVGARSDDLGSGAMVGTVSFYRIAPRQGDDGPRVLPGKAAVESFEVEKISIAETPTTIELGGRVSTRMMLAIAGGALALLAVAFVAWRRH